MEDILQRYFKMENSGTGTYFDTDEIVELLEFFEIMDDYVHYKKVMKLGQKLHPHSIDIKIQRCKFHIFNKKYEKALALIEKIGEADHQDLILMKWECLCALDRYDEVIAHLKALQYNPDEDLQDTVEYFAPILSENYNSNYALDFIKRGLALFPDSLPLKEELCFLYEKKGKIAQALEICKDLINSKPFSVDYRYIQGRLYAVMEAYDKAIEAFEYAAMCEVEDWELKIMLTYCHYMNDNYAKVIELYIDFFAEETENIHEYLRPFVETSDFDDCAYRLLRKMLEEFEFEHTMFPFNMNKMLSYSIENEDDINGFTLIADCFPGCLLFFLLKELSLMAEGDTTAILNIDQLLEVIFQTVTDNTPIDTVKKSCVSLKQQIETVLDEKTPDTDCNADDFNTVRQLLKHLLDGNMTMFCRQYEENSPQLISEYIEKIFLPFEIRQQTANLFSTKIRPDDFDYIPSNELATRYLTDKNHNN